MATTRRQEADSFAWFCDAPELFNQTAKPARVETPPLSQIPVLGLQPDVEKNGNISRYQVKDTDSEYTRMAKTGGRSNLLFYQEPQGSKDAIKYAKSVDWYDHQEHEKTKLKVQMVLPDYMNHKEFCPAEVVGEPQDVSLQNIPFPLDDNLSIFQREGLTAKDKTISLPEPKYKFKRTKDKIEEFQANEQSRYIRPVRSVVWNGDIPQEIFKNEAVTIGKLLNYDFHKNWHNQYTKQRERSTNRDEN